MKNPCYNKLTKTDCPDRKSGCGATCKKWADYVRERDEEYIKRYWDKAQSRNRISNFKARGNAK